MEAGHYLPALDRAGQPRLWRAPLPLLSAALLAAGSRPKLSSSLGLRAGSLHHFGADFRGGLRLCLRAPPGSATLRASSRRLLHREPQCPAHDLFPQRLCGATGLRIFPPAIPRRSATCRHCRSSPQILAADVNLLFHDIRGSVAIERTRRRYGHVFRRIALRVGRLQPTILESFAPRHGRISARLRPSRFLHRARRLRTALGQYRASSLAWPASLREFPLHRHQRSRAHLLQLHCLHNRRRHDRSHRHRLHCRSQRICAIRRKPGWLAASFGVRTCC